MCVYVLSRVQLFATPWTVAHLAVLSMEFPREEYWSGLPFPPPGELPNPGIEPMSPESPALQADSLPLSHQTVDWKPNSLYGQMFCLAVSIDGYLGCFHFLLL